MAILQDPDVYMEAHTYSFLKIDYHDFHPIDLVNRCKILYNMTYNVSWKLFVYMVGLGYHFMFDMAFTILGGKFYTFKFPLLCKKAMGIISNGKSTKGNKWISVPNDRTTGV